MSGGLSNFAQLEMLDHLIGAATYTPPVTLYGELYSVAPTGAGGGTVATGGGYARVAITNNLTNFPAATGGSPGTKSNGTVITFPTPTNDWSGGANMVAMALFDAASSGNMIAWGELLSDYTDAVPDSSVDTFTSAGHPFQDNDAVRVRITAGTVPTGLAEATKYYVRDRTATTWKLALTQGGSAVNFSDNGNGRIQIAKDAFKPALNGDVISFAVGTLTFQLTGT